MEFLQRYLKYDSNVKDLYLNLLPGNDQEDEVNWMLNDWIEPGIDPWLNEGFLEYRRESRSPYSGSFGEIVETDEHEHSGRRVEAILEKPKTAQ